MVKMHYEIDDSVGFEPVSGSLWLISTPDNRITLPRFASQLFEILIAENEKSLSRELLLDIIWHNNGLSASGNNLNNYISIIRRSLSSIGLNNVIITIPKYGFSFHAQKVVKVEVPLIRQYEEKTNIQDGCKPVCTETLLLQDKSKGVIVKLKWISLALFFVTLFLITLFFYFSSNSDMPKSVMEKYIGKYENCNIYTIRNGLIDFYSMDKISADIKSAIDNQLISCKLDSKIYFYKSATSEDLTFSSYRIVISQCLNDKQALCRNIHRSIVRSNLED
jgi:DNA-binding winged helix-turn-helix (wHTH) protein